MIEDDSLENTGTPSSEWWNNALTDPRFKAFIDSCPKPSWVKDNKKMIDRTVFVQFQKEGIHRYPDAPAGVEFLKHPHRHIFHFRVTISVTHNDRDIEFILFKRELENLYSVGTMEVDYKSCEMLAEDLINYISKNYPGRSIDVEVSEDGENGATLKYVPD